MRRIILNLKIALRSLYSFKLRTSLAVLGVFLGTFSLILVSNLTDSLVKKGEMEIEKLGKNLLVVRSGTVLRFGASTRLLTQATTLTLEDAKALEDQSPFVHRASPSSSKPFPVRSRNTTLSAILVTGVTADYPDIRNFHVQEGTFFSPADDQELARVAVLGKKVAEKLFGDKSPLGKYILIWRVPCQVIGVMEEKGVDVSNVDQDNQIFIPVNSFLRRFVNQEYVNTIFVQTTSSENMSRAKTQIEGILRKRHKIREGQKDDFTVIDSKDVMALKTQATSMISILGRISATVSFLIGALGILSIMILIVNERRVEIGIRRAVGSRKRDIVLQFLMESSFISLIGGMVGVVFGFLVSILVFEVSKLPFSISLIGFVISFVASVTVGILAGIYPSKKATTIQPVDIIRS
ncbi:ABC transporter permease [Desulforhabdus amnigena]|jgi:putative ABC transport system permease protein|uniref:ABC transporter permease n=1 Tax=Desulforhabdus amnigena TaxID=40218 RepID=A0A9W6FSS6_9BACT|nr:ABC transporter permease [Desulforhabdus amnigena]NLJ29362.1 FtsX-like permease family protein [Deltaproteobacteria bacterium]GLI34369.1 ABC transporter permease [Desulforhabdus amnigena]